MKKSSNPIITAIFALLITAAVIANVSAQTRKRKTVPIKRPTPVQNVIADDEHTPKTEPAAKKNERPQSPGETSEDRSNKRPSDAQKPAEPAFFPAYHYEFAQPDFVIPKIEIEHDENGKGKISFTKKGEEEPITDPIQLSPKTLEKINAALATLDFLNSTRNYQHEKDFSHLGTIVFRLTRGGKTRGTTFNWTDDKDAKTLMDEYRRVSNQFIWMFDLSVARENQPLESPRLIDSLDALIRRNEISDPAQMVPFLQSLVDDERIPLIARNHAGKLAKQIDKAKK